MSDKPKEFDFTSKRGLASLIGLLMLDGSMCPKCGYGTRKTSKNWRRCKRESCGERIHMIVNPSNEDRKNAAVIINQAINEACDVR